jgi:multidrug efflux pump
MIGVTAFGLFLTPVFYVALRAMTGNRPLKLHGEVPHIEQAIGSGSGSGGGALHAQPAAPIKQYE